MFNYHTVGSISKKNKKLAVKTTQDNDSGRNIFQPSLINWSNLYLGTMALTKETRINRANILRAIQKIPGTKSNG